MPRTQILTHMMPRDIPLFASYYLSPAGQAYTDWQFDVLVGNPERPPSYYPASAIRQALYLNALKIDAVGWLFDTPTLIECKPNAGLGALGQILGYQKWYSLIFQRQPRGIIVCERMSPQVETLCIIDQIEVVRVQPANDYLVDRAIESVKSKIKKRSVMPDLQAASF